MHEQILYVTDGRTATQRGDGLVQVQGMQIEC